MAKGSLDLSALMSLASAPKGAKAVPGYGGPQAMAQGGVQLTNYHPTMLTAPQYRPSAAGGRAEQIYQKAMAENDDMIVTERMTRLKQFMIDQKTNKDTGYDTIHGDFAIQPDENGDGLSDRVMAAATDTADGLMKGLTDKQKSMFAKQANAALTHHLGDVNQHVFVENEKRKIEVQQEASNQIIDNLTANGYKDDVSVEEALNELKVIGNKLNAIHGGGENTDVDFHKYFVGRAMSGVVSRLLTDSETNVGAIARAEKYKNKYKDFLDAEKLTKLNEAITKVRNATYSRIEGQRLGDALWGGVSPIKGSFGTMMGAGGAMANGNINDFFGGYVVKLLTEGKHLVQGLGATTRLSGEGGEGVGIGGARPEDVKALNPDLDIKRFGAADQREYNYVNSERHWGALMQRYGGDVTKAFVAYKHGMKAVDEAMTNGGEMWQTELMKSSGSKALKDAMEAKAHYDKWQRESFDPVTGKAGANAFDNIGGRGVASAHCWVPSIDAIRAAAKKRYPGLDSNSDYFENLVRHAHARVSEHYQSYNTNQMNHVNKAIDLIWQGQRVPNDILQNIDPTHQQQLDAIIRARQEKNDAYGAPGSFEKANRYISDPKLWAAVPKAEAKMFLASCRKDQRVALAKSWLAGNPQENQAYDMIALADMTVNKGGIPSSSIAGGKKGIGYNNQTGVIQEVMTMAVPGFSKLEEGQRKHAIAAVKMAMDDADWWGRVQGKTPEQTRSELFNYLRGWRFSDQNVFTLIAKDKIPNSGPSDVYNIVASMVRADLVDNKINRSEVYEDEVRKKLAQIMLNPGAITKFDFTLLDKDTVDYIQGELKGKDYPRGELLRRYVKYRLEGKQLITETQRIKGVAGRFGSTRGSSGVVMGD